jgi:hypothetical protein
VGHWDDALSYKWVDEDGTYWVQFKCPEDSQDTHSCGIGFLRTFRVDEGFQRQLRHRPSSLFMLFGCSSISMASLNVWSMYLDLVDRILVSWELDAMAKADAVFGHGRFIWTLQTNVPVVLLDPDVSGTAILPDVNLTTVTGYAVQTWSLESQAVLHRLKEASNLPQWEAHRLDVVP